MNPKTLEQRIQQAVRLQIDEIKKECGDGNDPFSNSFIFLVGNGLTRTAGSLRGGDDYSWDGWLQNILTSLNTGLTTAYLRSLGYNSTEVFEYALGRIGRLKRLEEQTERARTLWSKLWDWTRDTPFTVVHEAIVRANVPVLTTNYDDLLERTLHHVKHTGEPKTWALATEGSTFARFYPANSTSADLYKLHGGWYLTNKFSFEEWLKGWPWARQGPARAYPELLGPMNTIAYRTQYEAVARASEAEFNQWFAPVKLALTPGAGKRTTAIILGLGLSAEELIVSRLLKETRTFALVLTIDAPLDPLWRYWRLGPEDSAVVRLPLGLASSPQSRALAILVGVKCLLGEFRDEEKGGAGAYAGFVDEVKSKIVAPGAPAERGWKPCVASGDPNERLPGSYPRIVAVGQASVNRVIGLEDAVSQERAYSPSARTAASWAPDATSTKILTNVEVGGQALVPCLIWDALRIPSALVAKLYADEHGQRVLARLQKTNWLDFEWTARNQVVRSVSDPELGNLDGSVPGTDNATVVTWFGLRTIIDSKVHLEQHLRFSADAAPGAAGAQSCLGLGAPVVYATKWAWKETIDEFERNFAACGTSDRPLIVFDTGGRGKATMEWWIARNAGIIIASAYSTLLWYGVEHANLVTPDPRTQLGPETQQFTNRLEELQEEARRNLGGSEPKDDRGRIWQIRELLNAVRRAPRPWFLGAGNALAGLRAYVVTLGEMGCIYWSRVAGGDWIGPCWSRIDPPEALLKGMDEVPEAQLEDLERTKENHYRETRSGLECGDVARAGFTASLLASAAYAAVPDPLPLPILERALGWLNWFGAEKLRYFALDDFVRYVSTKAEVLERELPWNEAATGDSLEISVGDPATTHPVRFSNLLQGTGLSPAADRWFQWYGRLLGGAEGSREHWEREIRIWRRARGME